MSKNTSTFLFSVVFQQKKIRWSGDQWFHNASNYFQMAQNTKMQTEKKNNETKPNKEGRSERKNCQWKCFHSFNYVIDHASIRFFFYVNSLHWFLWSLLHYLLHLLSSDRFPALTRFSGINFIWIYGFFKNDPRKRVFCNESLSNLENVWQRSLRTYRARECILRVSEDTDFENFSARRQTWWHLCSFAVCTGLVRLWWGFNCLFS